MNPRGFNSSRKLPVLLSVTAITATVATSSASLMSWQSIWAFFSIGTPHRRSSFLREPALLELLSLINDHEIDPLWAEDETIGWIYQYYNDEAERKKMREESAAPRNSRELAVRNQFFTPRYVVEFLTDNTMGRIWYEMTQGRRD